MSIQDYHISFDITVWIYIRISDDALLLDESLKSLISQTYKDKINLVIIDDCNNDEQASVLFEKYKRGLPNIHTFIKKEALQGHNHNFKEAIEYIKITANSNDLFTELKAGDTYSHIDFIKNTVLYSVWNKAWLLYGNYSNYTDVLIDWNDPTISALNACFYFCSVFLLKRFTYDSCLSKASFLIKCVEMCGLERIYYDKRTHHSTKCHINVTDKLDIITNKLSIINEDLHIILCVRKRKQNLYEIIKSIEDQTFSKKIKLHIVSSGLVNDNDYKSNKIDIIYSECNSNVTGYSLFIYAKALINTIEGSYIVLLDDSCLLPEDWLTNLYNKRVPLGFCSSREVETIYLSNPEMCVEGGSIYGSLIDTSIFLNSMLLKLQEDFQRIETSENIWVSFIVNYVLGKPIIKVESLNRINRKNNIDSVFFVNVLPNTGHDFLMRFFEEVSSTKGYINNTKLKSLLNKEDAFDLKLTKNIVNKRPFAILCISIGKEHSKLFSVTLPTIKRYSEKTCANLIICDSISYEKEFIVENKFRSNIICYIAKAYEVYKLLSEYERVLLLDDTCYINNNCPNLFDLVPNNSVGGFVEPSFAGAISKNNLAKLKQNHGIDPVDVKKYVNSGIMVFSKCHKAFLSKESIQKNINCFSNFYPHQTYLIKMFMDNRVDVFDIGNLYNFMPAYELGYYKEPGAKFIKTLTNRQLTTLKSCFIIHFTSFNDFRVELIEQYKAFLENKDTYIT